VTALLSITKMPVTVLLHDASPGWQLMYTVIATHHRCRNTFGSTSHPVASLALLAPWHAMQCMLMPLARQHPLDHTAAAAPPPTCPTAGLVMQHSSTCMRLMQKLHKEKPKSQMGINSFVLRSQTQTRHTLFG
jgi:hypothetical protein